VEINCIKREYFEYIVIDNFYNKNELKEIYKEINFLFNFKLSFEKTLTATSQYGSFLKEGHGLFLDNFYKENRKKSNILNLNRKLFNKKILKEAKKVNLYFNHLFRCNTDHTLLNFYENNGYYNTHEDASVITAITMFKIGNFKGGNFIINKDEIEFKENRMILFAGCLPHKAKPIFCDKDNYRITTAQFLNYRI
jgi:hypothetical protein